MVVENRNCCLIQNAANVVIRKVNPKDLGAIVGLARELSKSESIMDPMVTPVSRFQDPAWILKNIEKDNAAVFVATFNGKVVGYILGWISQPWDYKFESFRFCFGLKGVGEVDILPYHDVSEKYNRLGMRYEMTVHTAPSEEKIKCFKEKLEKLGLFVKIGG